ncbi:dTMP kinase [Actinokineospora terrae]|uniref:Thymidylate kinase n=1 Tax=Actinokineospora terrae TaxID=155974 RepID=A0A1H9M9A9_9PSEU|nr:dTMP kinase [Actinokineospora terrae]SER20340.1 dTMP kinase [Actinokineospora terrae]
MTPTHRGLLITVDGPAGAGKTTTVRLLERILGNHGHHTHATTQPSHDAIGALARHNTDTYRGHTLACLVAADRHHHLHTVIRPHRDNGVIVLCDRYVPSSYVLQRIDGVPLDYIAALNAPADRPDLAVLLTAEPDIAAARVARRGAHDRFHQGRDTTRRELALYRDTTDRLLAQGWPIATLDTSALTPLAVAQRITTWVTYLIAHPHSATPTA